MCKTVSVIVPIYNREKILAECLGNLVNQTLKGMELILVNDGSTDHSLQVMRECERQFPELVRVIEAEQNLGPGGARNLGIEAAVGTYIGFVDCDDLPEIAMYEKLYQKAQEGGYDVVDCGYYRQEGDYSILHTADNLTGTLDCKKREELIVSGGYLFSKLYKRDLFEDPKLRFRQNVILEDADFLTYLFSVIDSIGSVKEVLYMYRNQPDSASKIVRTEKYYYNICEAMRAIFEKEHTLPYYEQIRDSVEYELLQMYSYGVNICVQAYLRQEPVDALKLLSQIADLKRWTVRGDYGSRYVKDKIAPMDIQLMQWNDESQKLLLERVRQIEEEVRRERHE